jgi:hypothetical protein
MLLSLLPICATLAMSRNSLFVAIGAFGLIAAFLGGFFTKESWVPRSRYWRVAAGILCLALLLAHVGVAAVGRTFAPRTTAGAFRMFYSTVKVGPSIDLREKTLVVVNAPNPFLFLGLPFFQDYWKEALPEGTRLLAPGFTPLEITRTGERTLLVTARRGTLLSTNTSRREFKLNFAYFYHHFNSLFRPVDRPFKVGEQVRLSDMSVQIAEVDDNERPTQIALEFSVSLDDPALRWLQWHWDRLGSGHYSTFDVPPVGQTVFTPGPFGEPQANKLGEISPVRSLQPQPIVKDERSPVPD